MESEEILIKIKTMNSTTFPINITKSSKISELKSKIFQKVRIQSTNQRLIYQGKVLDNSRKLEDYKIGDGDVIHLVETNNQNYQQPPNNNISTINNNNNISSRIMESFFPNFTNLLRRNSNETRSNSTNPRLLNNNINTNGISDSFKHLLFSNKYNFSQSGEILTQQINTISNLIELSANINPINAEITKFTYSSKNGKFKIGQWIDVQEVNTQKWIEGQIINMRERDNTINVHYLGRPRNNNEWIKIDSERIALFRTFTSQDFLKNYYCPYPNTFNNNDINNNQLSYTKKFEPVTNDLIIFIDIIKKNIEKILKIKEKFDNNYFESKIESDINLRYLNLLHMQLFPMLDKIGRLFVDLSNYLMYSSYKSFEDNIYLFKKNLSDESLRFMNVNDSSERVIKARINYFQKLCKFSVLKTNKECDFMENNNSDFNNNNNSNQNNNRPQFGIILNLRSYQQTREEEIRNAIQRSRNYNIVNENFVIKNHKKKYKKKFDVLIVDKIKNIVQFLPKKKNEKIVINAKEKKIGNKNVNKSNQLNATKTKFKISNKKGSINSKK